MGRVDALPLPNARWRAEYLEDTALRNLVLEHYDREQLALRRYVSSLGIDSDVAQDLVHDAFLKLHEHLLAGGERTNLRAWLYRVVHNLARNVQTACVTRKTQGLSSLAETGGPAVLSASVEEMLLKGEREAAFRRAVEDLSVAQKQALLLRADGFKYREIGEILQLSTSAVAENIQRGLQHLKELL